MLEYTKRKCPYCKSEGIYHFRYFSSNFFKCSKCELIYRNKAKNYREIVLKYKNHYHDDYGVTEINGKRNNLYLKIIKFIERKIQVGELLDVGTGCGYFLLFAKERGWKVSGIDPSLKSIEIAKKNFNLDVTVNTLKEINSREKFDIITFINVLDHSAEPWKEIERAKKLLKPNGFIFIRSPNGFFHSLILRISSKLGFQNRASKFLVFHEYSFTFKYIKRLLIDYGFSNIEFQNSPPSEESIEMFSITHVLSSFFCRLIYFMSVIIETLSFRQLFVGSSLWIIASQDQFYKAKF